MQLSRNLVMVEVVDKGTQLVAPRKGLQRVAVTSSRAALNRYQKGKCFYCFDDITIEEKSVKLTDVDHFFPHTLKQTLSIPHLDGVWNLVLACQRCNRGTQGKFARVPALRYLERLHTRNEFFISSHHPLRETIRAQTGENAVARRQFLQLYNATARSAMIHEWSPAFELPPAF